MMETRVGMPVAVTNSATVFHAAPVCMLSVQMTPTEADAAAPGGYTFYPARMPEPAAAAVAYGNHIATQPCTLTPAPIVVEPAASMPILAQTQPAGSAMPHRHAKHSTEHRYAPYHAVSREAAIQHGSAAPPLIPAMTNSSAHANHTSAYEQTPNMGSAGGMQATPTSPQQLQTSMDPSRHSHYSHDDRSMKQSGHAEYSHYPNGPYKVRRPSEMAQTPDGMGHRSPLYGEMGAGTQTAHGDRGSIFITPPPPSSGVAIMHSHHMPARAAHYDDGKAQSVATTPHQYGVVPPQMAGYDAGAEHGDQATVASPTAAQLHADNGLWQPTASLDMIGRQQHAHISQGEYGGRPRPKNSSGDTLPSPETSSPGGEDCEGASSSHKYLPLSRHIGQKLKPSDEFTTVPGRLSLLGSASKYIVTIGEIQRRLSPPECLNASLLGGVLRKAKARNGGTDLRRALEEIGLHLPPGRRKAAGTSMLTSLVEEEARSLASQFNGICRKMFPTAELATTVCRQQSAMMGSHGGQQQVDDRQQAIKNAMQLTSELSVQLQSYLDQEEADRDNDNVNFPGLRQFSLITHSFGVLVVQGVLQVFQGYLNNLMKTTGGMVIRDHALQHQPPVNSMQHTPADSSESIPHSMHKQHR
eukprot:scpid34714/ scgid3231/ Transcription factor AP-2-epsilon